jgi:hypothetical protein
MRDRDLRVSILSALQPAPDFSGFDLLRRSNRSRQQGLLRWLDQSGIALYLLDKLQQHDALDHVPADFRQALERRSHANRERSLAMLGEFERIVEYFNKHSVRFCVLKGFALIPDFCSEPHLRHQIDFDFLVAPESLDAAKCAMQFCGYTQQATHQSNEVTFATPLQHIPSANDDIYAIPRHREVDLLTAVRQVAHGVSIEAPSASLDKVSIKTLRGISFPSLPAEDMFALQVMHAFKHLLGSWVRVSWLLELGYFIDRHYDDADLWRSVIDGIGRDERVRNAFGLIVSLTQTLFPSPLPHLLADWCLRPLSPRIQAWVTQFGVKTAISDLDGTKLTLFVHRLFVDDENSWNAYVRNRLFPIGRQSPIGNVTTARPRDRIKVRASQWLHSVRRATFHARELVCLPVEAVRWWLALRSVEKQRVLVSQALTR